MRVEEILSRFPDAKKSGSCWQCRCPAHDDRDPSLSISQGDKGIILHCHAGCTPDAVCAALGLKIGDLFADKPERNGHAKKIVAAYDYHDRNGKLIFQVVRFEPKDFRQRKPDATAPDGWAWNTRGVSKVLFRLPEILADISSGKFIFLVEGEKDALALAERGISATCNPGGAGKWQDSFSETLRGVDVVIIADKDAPGRAHAQLVAGKLHGVAKSVRVIELPDVDGKPVKDAADFFAAGGDAGQIFDLVDITPEWTPAIKLEVTEPGATADDLQRALADARPKIRLPGSDRLLSDFATELVRVLRDKDIFWRNGEIVTLADGDLKPMTPQTFRCWAEQFFIGYRAKTIGENNFQFNVTMSDNEARGTLAAPQFANALRHVRRVNHARLPVFGSVGTLKLLPDGYHEPTQTLTLADVEYDLQMPLAAAVETINELLAEFCFADGERSKAVAVAAMVGIFANQLLPVKSLRPCFVFVANAEGAGKTLLAQICITPTLGTMPTGCKSTEDDEIRKNLTTAILEARQVVFFDNLKGRLSSPVLEAFLSAPVWTDRKLRLNESVTGENLATCFVTGNGMTVSPDMRRRSLFVELHQEAERAEDRKFNRLLDLPTLLELRPNVLAAFWAMVKDWNAQGRPTPSRGHSAFPSWSNIIGGIVEAAGFACPLTTANVTAAADPDAEDMRKLVSAMADKPVPLSFADLVQLAREQGLFESIIGTDGEELGRREKSALSRLLARYDRRMVSNYRFSLDGKGHQRRYHVRQLENDHATKI